VVDAENAHVPCSLQDRNTWSKGVIHFYFPSVGSGSNLRLAVETGGILRFLDRWTPIRKRPTSRAQPGSR
jgi:hypothetical protein